MASVDTITVGPSRKPWLDRSGSCSSSARTSNDDWPIRSVSPTPTFNRSARNGGIAAPHCSPRLANASAGGIAGASTRSPYSG